MRVQVITDGEALAAIEPAWRALFARVPGATPFASPAWLLPWWRIFAPGDLFAVGLWLDERLVGLAPLYTEDGPLGRRLLPLGTGLSDALDVLLDPDHATTAGHALGQVIAEAQRTGEGGWDGWSAEEAAPGAAILSIATPGGWRSDIEPQSACPVLSCPADGALQAAIPARQRRKRRMAQHRAARRAAVLTSSTRPTLHDDLDHLFRLHGARWESRGEGGVLADPAVRRFHAEAAPRLMEAGLLRLTTLRLDDEVAGVYYGFRHGTTAYAYLGGFDPAFAFESPGTVLLGAAIDEAATEGATTFSFLRGREAYKYAWGAIDRWNRRRLFQPGPA